MKKKNFVFIILGVLFVLNIFAWIAVYDFSKPKLLSVNFLDVGQGDATFIETPNRQQILIDGGPSSVILEKLGKEMPFWDRTIDLMILSHPEADHMIGLLKVLKIYKVENVLWVGIARDTPEYKEWVDLVEKEGAKIFIAKTGQEISAGNVNFEIISPATGLEGKVFKDSNDTSIVLKLVFGKESFLFTGDIYNSIEKELIIRENSCGDSCKFASLDSDVLKVAHHGSKTSTSEEFLERVSPEIAIISDAKDNSYGHPHKEVLDRLKKYANILRTDESGDIEIVSDGNNLKITNN
jgi:competence protein ComEC